MTAHQYCCGKRRWGAGWRRRWRAATIGGEQCRCAFAPAARTRAGAQRAGRGERRYPATRLAH